MKNRIKNTTELSNTELCQINGGLGFWAGFAAAWVVTEVMNGIVEGVRRTANNECC